MDSTLSFAAFIMTYQRNTTLEDTIKIMFEQTVVPQKILIVDNDPSEGARVVAQKLSHLPISYHAVGYNSGPAGAAKRGLEILSEEGYEWIGWIDDDDPPLFQDSFEIILQRATQVKNCGSAGAVGQRFDAKKAMMVRVPDKELEQEGMIEVDNIAGGMCKIVNANAIKIDKILPDEKLFYGFEELDFDLRLKKAGYILVADAQLYKRNRVYHNRIGYQVKRGQKKPIERLWREYYSTRNLLMIIKKEKRYSTLFLFIIKSFFKSIAGFRYGITYGLKNFRYVNLGVLHFLMSITGKLN